MFFMEILALLLVALIYLSPVIAGALLVHAVHRLVLLVRVRNNYQVKETS